MKVRMNLHVEPDGGTLEAWVTTYDPQGHQHECYSTHRAEVLGTLDSVLELLGIIQPEAGGVDDRL